MPESRKRKQAGSTRRPATATAPKQKGPSPRWLAPLMLFLFGLGVLWLVVYYLTQGDMAGLPGVSEIGDLNLLVGFGLSTQWR